LVAILLRAVPASSGSTRRPVRFIRSQRGVPGIAIKNDGSPPTRPVSTTNASVLAKRSGPSESKPKMNPGVTMNPKDWIFMIAGLRATRF